MRGVCIGRVSEPLRNCFNCFRRLYELRRSALASQPVLVMNGYIGENPVPSPEPGFILPRTMLSKRFPPSLTRRTLPRIATRSGAAIFARPWCYGLTQ